MILRPGECVGPETKRERFFRGILISGPAEDRLRRRGKTLLSLFFLSLISFLPFSLSLSWLPFVVFSCARDATRKQPIVASP